MGGRLPMMIYRNFLCVRANNRCAFALWHGHRKLTFRMQKQATGEGKEKHSVPNVGLPGDIVILMARSRVERDLWVTALGQEIIQYGNALGEELKVS